MVILRTRNKITDFLMILAWASPFNIPMLLFNEVDVCGRYDSIIAMFCLKFVVPTIIMPN